MILTQSTFSHRQNRDESFDSICRTCWRTIANARIESELAKDEENHVCNPSILYQRIHLVGGRAV
jgi:hypothetical protein